MFLHVCSTEICFDGTSEEISPYVEGAQCSCSEAYMLDLLVFFLARQKKFAKSICQPCSSWCCTQHGPCKWRQSGAERSTARAWIF